jgi:dimethylamine/trimethylamine dehydrogenase
LTGIQPGRLTARDHVGDPVELEADAVVLVTQRLSSEDLFLNLKRNEDALTAEGIEAVYRIGDCVAPRLIAEAVFEGHRLAREIDAEDPGVPLPYKRERLVLEQVAT